MHDVIASKRFLIFLAGVCLLVLSGCVSVQTDVIGGANLKSYKSVYIEPLVKDEFQIYSALAFEMNDMGMAVIAVPHKNPTENDLIVKYSYEEGWDVTPYLQSFQFQFINAKSGRLIATQSYKSRGIWHGVRDGRLKSAFNDFRKRNGFPPSKQFN